MSTYTIRTYPDGEADSGEARAAAKALWQVSLGPVSALDARWESLWLRSPYGRPILRFVVDEPGNEVVGVAAIAPRRMLQAGREIRVGILAHFAVSPDHRSLGPALTLLGELLAQAREHYEGVIGIPRNSPGAGAVLKRAGLQPLARLVRRVKLLRHAHYLKRKLPAALAQPAGLCLDAARGLPERWRRLGARALDVRWNTGITGIDQDIDALWLRSSPHEGLASVRDSHMLGWRFDPSTAGQIRYLCLRDAHAGKLLAWFACSADPQWPHILNVEDFWAQGAQWAMPLAFIDALSRQALHEGYAAISLEFAGTAERDAPWLRAGFVERDSQQVYAAFAPGTDVGDLHLTNLDRDG